MGGARIDEVTAEDPRVPALAGGMTLAPAPRRDSPRPKSSFFNGPRAGNSPALINIAQRNCLSIPFPPAAPSTPHSRGPLSRP
ncbi:hypothetical protein L810_2071 [Burkholderia sp. AU4i]|nr:hypothetical protein L810_2071 [Burkholderia sp. AU4i]MDW9230445.1 hypothetical protein [Burkholderia cepacia]